MTRIRTGAVLAITAILFAACQGTAASPSASSAPSAAPPSAPASTAPSVAPSSAIKDGGTLVVGLPGDMVLADPSLVSDSNSSYIQLNVVEGLLGVKPGTLGEIVPVLAEALPEASADGLTYTFKLRQGIKFHDGTDFNADAVVYNYERQLNAPAALRDAYNYYFGAIFGWAEKSNLASVTKVDDSTVKFTLKTPQSNFLISQAPLPQFGIQSPTALKAGDADNPDPSKSKYAQGQGTGMVGTGPFKFTEWVPNDHVTISKNPDYWNKDEAAHLDTVIFKPFADQSAELNALQSDGGIDFAQTILPNDIAGLKTDANYQVIDRGESCNYGGLQMNQTHKPFDNLHIRTAIDVRRQQAVVHRRVLCRAGRAGRQLDAAGDAVLEGPEPAEVQHPEGQGRGRRIRSERDAAEARLLVSVRRRATVHAGPEGPGRSDRDRPRGGRLHRDVPYRRMADRLPGR